MAEPRARRFRAWRPHGERNRPGPDRRHGDRTAVLYPDGRGATLAAPRPPAGRSLLRAAGRAAPGRTVGRPPSSRAARSPLRCRRKRPTRTRRRARDCHAPQARLVAPGWAAVQQRLHRVRADATMRAFLRETCRLWYWVLFQPEILRRRINASAPSLEWNGPRWEPARVNMLFSRPNHRLLGQFALLIGLPLLPLSLAIA